MSAKVPARVRAQAIELLRCAEDAAWFSACHALGLGLGSIARAIAWEAFIAVCAVVPRVDAPLLEAAALLEDGWCPGDPVVRR